MERIINYKDLPYSYNQSIYLRNETDPKLYINLISKGYKVVKNITEADSSTIYVTGRRQDYQCNNTLDYKYKVDNNIQKKFNNNSIFKPKTSKFSYDDLINYKYQLPFVLKNENQNGGREKFLINTEADYENLISACDFLIDNNLKYFITSDIKKINIDYKKYLDFNFSVQEYIQTPSVYNTTIRVLTSSSKDLLYASLKYNKPELYKDNTTLLGYLLSDVYPLSTKSIVSNTLSGGENILIGENNYSNFDKKLLDNHNINSDKFYNLLNITKNLHNDFKSELGIICGFDYIYDINEDKWFLLEYHSRPMLGDYSKRCGLLYNTKEERLTAEGRVRATALSLTLKKTR